MVHGSSAEGLGLLKRRCFGLLLWAFGGSGLRTSVSNPGFRDVDKRVALPQPTKPYLFCRVSLNSILGFIIRTYKKGRVW